MCVCLYVCAKLATRRIFIHFHSLLPKITDYYIYHHSQMHTNTVIHEHIQVWDIGMYAYIHRNFFLIFVRLCVFLLLFCIYLPCQKRQSRSQTRDDTSDFAPGAWTLVNLISWAHACQAGQSPYLTPWSQLAEAPGSDILCFLLLWMVSNADPVGQTL